MGGLGVIDTGVIDTFGEEIVDASEPLEPSFEIQTGSAQIVLKGEDAYGSRKLVLESSDELHVTFVCDGHGGAAAAQLCADKLLPILIEEARGDGSTASLQRAATRACARLHAEARAASTAGSTLTCIIVYPGRREVTAFNLGDSAAWMVPRDGSAATLLAEDHRLDTSEAERERVIALGGRLAHARGLSGEPGGPLRLWPGGGVGGAAQARVLGDSRLGDFVDATPAVTSLKLPRCGADFLVCSDGVWDALPAEAVLATVRGMMRSPVTLAASAIVESALNQRHAYDCDGYRRPRDDTTALLLRVRRSDEAEVLPAGGCLGCS